MKTSKRNSPFPDFSRTERLGLGVLLLLVILVFIFPSFSSGTGSRPLEADSSWIKAARQLVQVDSGETNAYRPYAAFKQEHRGSKYPSYPAAPASYFYFDPNTIDAAGWKKLGLRDKTIQTILHYREKGGRFRKAEDLQRVYGLFPDEYAKLEPWIQIATAERPSAALTGAPVPVTTVSKTDRPRYAIVDINTADTSALIALPGIGGKLAARIIAFRDKLGGFIATEQVAETYGLPDSTFQKIKTLLRCGNSPFRKININTAGIDELKAHPYIRWQLAKPILAYRESHGPFRSADDLLQVQAADAATWKKIIPYLQF